METIVAIADADSALLASLRVAGWRVRQVPPRSDLAELALYDPDVLVFELPFDALESALEELAELPDLAQVPTLAYLLPSDLRQLPKLSRLNDFILPQTSREESSARLRRLLKPRLQVASSEGPILSCGGLRIDTRSFAVYADGAPLELTYQEFLLLRYLVAHPEQAHTREQLLAKVWGWDYYGGARTVDIHVRRVRAKIGAPYAQWLETVRHVGYRWAPPSEPSSSLRASDSQEPS